MEELWDLYDEQRNKIGKTCRRGVDPLLDGEYHIVVTAIIINSENKILVSKRAAFKKHPLVWECNGGSIKTGESSLQGMLREVEEELGLKFTKEEATFLKEIKATHDFKDLWVFRRDVKIEEITFPDGEAIEAKWVTMEELEEMYERGETIPTLEFKREDYNKALELTK